MKHQSIVATICAFLFVLLGCEREAVTHPASAGPFNVNSDTGMATGQAFGINFKAEGATRADVTSELAGSPKSASRSAITLADDLKIELEAMAEGNSVAFRLNGKSFGKVAKGDEVAIGKDRIVMVNGVKQTNAENPAK